MTQPYLMYTVCVYISLHVFSLPGVLVMLTAQKASNSEPNQQGYCIKSEPAEKEI